MSKNVTLSRRKPGEKILFSLCFLIGFFVALYPGATSAQAIPEKIEKVLRKDIGSILKTIESNPLDFDRDCQKPPLLCFYEPFMKHLDDFKRIGPTGTGGVFFEKTFQKEDRRITEHIMISPALGDPGHFLISYHISPGDYDPLIEPVLNELIGARIGQTCSEIPIWKFADKGYFDLGKGLFAGITILTFSPKSAKRFAGNDPETGNPIERPIEDTIIYDAQPKLPNYSDILSRLSGNKAFERDSFTISDPTSFSFEYSFFNLISAELDEYLQAHEAELLADPQRGQKIIDKRDELISQKQKDLNFAFFEISVSRVSAESVLAGRVNIVLSRLENPADRDRELDEVSDKVVSLLGQANLPELKTPIGEIITDLRTDMTRKKLTKITGNFSVSVEKFSIAGFPSWRFKIEHRSCF